MLYFLPLLFTCSGCQTMARAFDLTSAVLTGFALNRSLTSVIFFFLLSCPQCVTLKGNSTYLCIACVELHSLPLTWYVLERGPGTTETSPIVCTEIVRGEFGFPAIHVLDLATLFIVAHETEHPLDFVLFYFLKEKAKYFTSFLLFALYL